MKAKSIFIGLFFLVSSVAVMAENTDPRRTGFVVVPVKNTEVFKIIYQGESVGKVRLIIYDAHNEVVYSQLISGMDGFIYPMNFAGLSSGEYTIELIDATGSKTEKVNYVPSYQRAKKASKIQSIHVSKISAEKGKFLLAIASRGSEKIQVDIYDANETLVHTEVKEITGDFAQVYKFQNPSRTYFVTITDEAGNINTARF